MPVREACVFCGCAIGYKTAKDAVTLTTPTSYKKAMEDYLKVVSTSTLEPHLGFDTKQADKFMTYCEAFECKSLRDFVDYSAALHDQFKTTLREKLDPSTATMTASAETSSSSSDSTPSHTVLASFETLSCEDDVVVEKSGYRRLVPDKEDYPSDASSTSTPRTKSRSSAASDHYSRIQELEALLIDATTHTVRLTQALQRSAEREAVFRDFFDHSCQLQGMCEVLDADSLHIVDNNATLTALGFTDPFQREKLRENYFLCSTVADDTNRLMWHSKFKEAVDMGGKKVDFEYEQVYGEQRTWFSGVTKFVKWNELTMRPICVYSMTDITERKRMEDTLRATERKLQVALEATNDGTFQWDIKTGEIQFSQRWYKMFGYSHKDLAPTTFQTLFDLIHLDDHAYTEAWFQALLTSSHLDLPSADDSSFFLPNSSPTSSTETAFHGKHTLTIRKESSKQTACIEADCLVIPRIRMRTQSGGYKWITTRALVVEREGPSLGGLGDEQSKLSKPLQLIGAILDVTHQVLVEQQLERKNDLLDSALKKAEVANESKSEFVANISHEVRTPLNGILGFTDILLASPLNVEQRDLMNTIRACSEALLNIVNDILDLQKIESGKLELEEEPFSLRACIESAFFLLDNKASAKGLQLTYRISPLVLVKTMVGDVGRLRQVVVNLLHNGIKFTERGRVRLEVDLAAPESEGSESTDSSPKTLLERRGDGYCRLKFCIVDTGIGIPPERLKKLFKPFSQVDASTSRKYGGTGLGLAICRQLVALMGGHIDVKSDVGNGSQFIFTCGFREASAEEADARELGYERFPQSPKDICDFDRESSMTIASDLGLNSNGYSMEERRDLATMAGRKPSVDCLNDYSVYRSRTIGGSLPDDKTGPHGLQATVPTGGSTSHLTHPASNSAGNQVVTADESAARSAVNDNRAPPHHTNGGSRIGQRYDSKMAEKYPLNILIAEDNVVNQKLISLILQKFGYQPDVAWNGREVIQVMEQAKQRYDIIFMDVQMPEMSGIECTQYIRKNFSRNEQPLAIIALTANAMCGDQEKFIKCGMDEHIPKPFTVNRIIDVLRRLAIVKARSQQSSK